MEFHWTYPGVKPYPYGHIKTECGQIVKKNFIRYQASEITCEKCKEEMLKYENLQIQ